AEAFAAESLQGEAQVNTWDQKALMLEKQEKEGEKTLTRFEKLRNRYLRFIQRMMPYRKVIVSAYLLLVTLASVYLLMTIGKDVLPKVNASQFQVRMRAPEGTRIERTEALTMQLENVIKE